MAGSGLLFLGALSCYSLIAVVAYFGLSLVLLGLGSKLYVHLMGLLKKPCKDPLAKVESLHLEVTEEQVQGILSQVTNHINVAAATTKRLLLVEDYLESAKFALAAYLATFLGAVMNSLTLVIIAWVAAFSLPTVYAAILIPCGHKGLGNLVTHDHFRTFSRASTRSSTLMIG